MRNLEEIENDLALARKESKNVTGTQAEVYSRIVGYYRSVRNWNKGKREEYGERKLFEVDNACQLDGDCAVKVEAAIPLDAAAEEPPVHGNASTSTVTSAADKRLKLFVRPHCPACPGAKAAAGKLGIPVDTVDADTEAGLAEAAKMNVLSTPTAILLSKDGKELRRVRDAASIAGLLEAVA